MCITIEHGDANRRSDDYSNTVLQNDGQIDTRKDAYTMTISALRILVLIPLMLYSVLGLLIPDFAQARHAVMLTPGLSFVVLLDAILAALVARR